MYGYINTQKNNNKYTQEFTQIYVKGTNLHTKALNQDPGPTGTIKHTPTEALYSSERRLFLINTERREREPRGGTGGK